MSETSPSARRRGSVTMADVAKHAGVSLGTVSNVLNKPNQVRPELVARVRSSIAELGFSRNNAARSLAAGHSRTIGFVMVDLVNSYFVDMARGAEAVVRDADMFLLLANSDIRESTQAAYLDHFDQEQVAGILLTPVGGNLDGMAQARAHGRPVVIVDSDPHLADCCSVSTDNVQSGYIAARHLIDLGRRRLAFAGGPRDYRPIADRLAGAERAVREAQGVTLEYLASGEVQVPQGLVIGHDLVERPAADLPDGIIAATDLLALGILQGIFSRSELRIPDDVALVACDDNRSAYDSIIPISTVELPGIEMGRASAQLLLDEVRWPDDHTHRRVILEPHLIARESTLGRSRLTVRDDKN
jgi:LacI family transcriptional regulator